MAGMQGSGCLFVLLCSFGILADASRGSGRSLLQGSKGCSVASAVPINGSAWYTLVNNTASYDYSAPAGATTTLRCSTSGNSSLSATCSAAGTWSIANKAPECGACDLDGGVLRFSPDQTGYLVAGLTPGETRTLQVTTTEACNQNPIRSLIIQNEDKSYGFMLPGDSPVDRWVTASTCGLFDVEPGNPDGQTDTILRVRNGCFTPNTEIVAKNDDFCGFESKLSFLAKAGLPYTIYVSRSDRECFLNPNITISATLGSAPQLSMQSYLVSPVQAPGQCFTAASPTAPLALTPCNSSNLTQYIQVKDVGNGYVFLRTSYWTNGIQVLQDTTVPSAQPFAEPFPAEKPPNDLAQFVIRNNSNSAYQIYLPAANACMELAAGNMVLASCMSPPSPAQTFTLTKPTVVTSPQLLGLSFTLKPGVAQSLCWTSGTTEGADMTLQLCSAGNLHQQFVVQNATGGFVQLKDMTKEGRVVSLSPGSLADNTALVTGAPRVGAPEQLWSLLEAGRPGAYRVISAVSGQCAQSAQNLPNSVLQQSVCGQGLAVEGAQVMSLNYTGPPLSPPAPSTAPVPGVTPRGLSPPGQQGPTQPPGAAPPDLTVLPTGPSPPDAGGSPTLQQDTSSSSSASKGVIAAAVAVPVVVVIGLLGCVVLVVRRRRRRGADDVTKAKSLSLEDPEDYPLKPPPVVKEPPVSDAASVRQKLHVKGLVKGEPFLRGAAPHYTWTDLVPAAGVTAVEEGVNAEQLDQLSVSEESRGEGESGPVGSSPVVKLTGAEVAQQIQLLKEGLLGRGATALVFQCRWPSRFGPHALLAAKVLRDPFEDNSEHLQAFMYEARVLEDLRHPNIVRLYGYCLEPPTVCLIMELLPSSLKKVLAGGTTQPSSTTRLGVTPGSTPAHTTALGTTPLSLSPMPTAMFSAPTFRDSCAALSTTAASNVCAQDPASLSAESNARAPSDITITVRSGPLPGMKEGEQEGRDAEDGAAAVDMTPGPSMVLSEATTWGNTPNITPTTSTSQAQCTVQLEVTTSGAGKEPSASSQWDHFFPMQGSSTSTWPAMSPWPGTPAANSAVLPLATAGSGTDSEPSRQSAAGTTAHYVGGRRNSTTVNMEQNTPRTSLGDRSSHHLQVTSGAKLSMHDVLRISTDVACGLAFLHQKPAPALDTVPSGASSTAASSNGSAAGKESLSMIVHRDLKPDNVLLNSRGVAKISDFGLARVHDSTTIYSVHMAVGTLRYMAPELLDCDTPKSMTDKVDLYSLGMLMWEMVTGEPPWKGLTDPQIMTAVQMKKRPSMSAHSAPSAANSRSSLLITRPMDSTTTVTRSGVDLAAAAEDVTASRATSSVLSGSLALSPVSATQPSLGASGALDSPTVQPGVRVSLPGRLGYGPLGSTVASAGPEGQDRSSAPSRLGAPAAGVRAGAEGPASFDAVPQFKTLISSCWQHNSLRRPTAKAVHRVLLGLVKQQEQQQQ